MSILKNNKVIAVGDVNTYHPPILSCMWSDHIINDIQWLRADTFSWQDGTVYATIYDKLVEEWNEWAASHSFEIDMKSEGGVYYIQTSSRYKIAPASQESNILNKYNTDGIAWYYILDTTNKRFKLPRMNYKYWKKQDTLSVMGNGISLGLTSGSSNFAIATQLNSGAFLGNTNVYGSPVGSALSANANAPRNVSYGITTDGSKSGIVADVSNSVEETGFYLYFYVGEYSQSAIEQTAGLNVELFNGKLDINASGLSTQGKSYVSGLGMPSSRYIDLTLGASATAYTAPDNGWINIVKKTSAAGQYVELGLSNSVRFRHTAYASGESCMTSLPVYKGQYFYVIYTAASDLTWFRFIYAKGSQ